MKMVFHNSQIEATEDFKYINYLMNFLCIEQKRF